MQSTLSQMTHTRLENKINKSTHELRLWIGPHQLCSNWSVGLPAVVFVLWKQNRALRGVSQSASSSFVFLLLKPQLRNHRRPVCFIQMLYSGAADTQVLPPPPPPDSPQLFTGQLVHTVPVTAVIQHVSHTSYSPPHIMAPSSHSKNLILEHFW